MNDLLTVELRDDNLNMFDQAWEETLMAVENAPERDLLKSLYHRQLGKSTLVKSASALYYSHPVH